MYCIELFNVCVHLKLYPCQFCSWLYKLSTSGLEIINNVFNQMYTNLITNNQNIQIYNYIYKVFNELWVSFTQLYIIKSPIVT